jgi:hypothetical protein
MTMEQETRAGTEGPGCQSFFEATVADSRSFRLWSHDESEEIAAIRAVGLITLLLLPEPGLSEAVEELRDVAQFHWDQAALGAPKGFEAEVGLGRIVESVERPVLAIED